LSFYLLLRRFKLKKFEAGVLSFAIGAFVQKSILYVFSNEGTDPFISFMLIAYLIITSLFTVTSYIRKKNVLAGFGLGILTYFIITILTYAVLYW